MKRLTAVVGVMAMVGVAQWPAVADAAKHALLIGVGDYQSPRVEDLEGPPNDVAAVRSVLIRRWGFRSENIRTLVDSQATRAAILREFERLEQRSAPGDQLFVYFSGHGTSVHDPKLRLNLPDNSGAQAPWDVPMGTDKQAIVDGLIVGRRDLRPIFHRLDQGGRHVFAVFDSCYSGNGVRSVMLGNDLPSRNLSTGLPRDLTARILAESDREFAKLANCFDCGYVRQDEPYPYRNLVFIAAATDQEEARDIDSFWLRRHPTLDGKPHGAMTDALLRVLDGELNADADGRDGIEYGELHATLVKFLEDRGIRHTPQLLPWQSQDRGNLASKSMFGTRSSTAPPPAASSTGGGSAPRPFRVALDPVLPPDVGRAVLGIHGVTEAATRPDLRIVFERGKVKLLKPAGDIITEVGANELASITDAVRRQRWLHKVLRRGLPASAAGFNMNIELADGSRGNSAVIGDHIWFSVKSERRVHLMLLDLMPDGSIVALYPRDPADLRPLPAGQSVQVPERSRPIRVVEPPGTDQVIALGFTESHPIMRELATSGTDLLAPRLQARIEHLLENPTVRAAGATLSVYTLRR